MLRPLRNFGEQISRYQETQGALSHGVDLILKDQAQTKAKLNQLREAHSRGIQKSLKSSIELTAVEAGYNGKSVMAATALSLTPGKSIAIVGPSGAGKSTLLKVMAGLISPLVWKCNLDWSAFTELTSFVSQEPFLFSDSIRCNLIYGVASDQETTAKEIEEALRAVNVLDEIMALPGGLETNFHALGNNLSGGQIQRLVIARALLRRRPILLLDEATSAVDAKSEREIVQRAVKMVRDQDMSLVVVTHRLLGLEVFDEIWFVEAGEVRLRGKHEALQESSRYREYCEFARIEVAETGALS
jgi:ABC-type multidrug transport system fused ATPase/permease subunit